MNQQEAKRAARKIWGKRAVIRAEARCHTYPHARDERLVRDKIPGPVRWYCTYHGVDEDGQRCPGGRSVRLVGHIGAFGLGFIIEGAGTNWAEAFAAAARHNDWMRGRDPQVVA